MEDQIVSILKKLISESDYLLNLHDGVGYYHPTYIDKWRNSTLFGQSIVADSEEYRIPGSGKSIKLGEMAKKILNEVNPTSTGSFTSFTSWILGPNRKTAFTANSGALRPTMPSPNTTSLPLA